jgi:hypothetical protein
MQHPDAYKHSPNNASFGSQEKYKNRYSAQWTNPAWRKEWRKRRREKLIQDARESRAGVQTFLTMADLAIRMAVFTEPNKEVRQAKQKELRARWRQYQRELLGISRA